MILRPSPFDKRSEGSGLVGSFGDRVVAEARAWVGTPAHWQQSVKGVGCDCKGLIAGVARELGRPEADSLFARKADYREGRIDTQLLRGGLAALFDRVSGAQRGDIMLLLIGGLPQHLAFVVDADLAGQPSAMIQCTVGGRLGVRERRVLPQDRIDSVWRWRELENHLDALDATGPSTRSAQTGASDVD